jgi:hypothetical protein
MANQNNAPSGNSQQPPVTPPAAPNPPGGSSQQPPGTPPAAPNGKQNKFIAEADCIYDGRYVTAGTIVFAEADEIPHFKRV